MNKLFTLSALILALLAMTPQHLQAQDDLVTTGYTNVWIDVKATPNGGGRVFASPQEAAIKVWRDEVEFRQTITVGEFMGAYMTIFFLYANPADGYIFAGWYEDDGDGVFDIEKDAFLSTDTDYLMLGLLSDDATVYATQSEAKSGVAPTKTDGTIFAHFTRGATAGVSFYQGADQANCGSVFVSKAVNEPGDEVTFRAIANDGFKFEYWKDASFLGEPVSYDNPYTFTVQGGEQLYAYFSAIDGPEVTLPEEGGFKSVIIDRPWVLGDAAMKNGAHVLVMEAEDFTRTADGKTYLDMEKEDTWVDVAQMRGIPTLIYGKGKVRFDYQLNGYGIARSTSPLVKYSGEQGASLKGDLIYVYVFIEELGAFVEIGNTDTFANPNAPTSVSVPPMMTYFSMAAFDLTDDQGNIPHVIGLSPETFDSGMANGDNALQRIIAAVEGVKTDTRTIGGQQVYTLSGLRIAPTGQKGIYIVNGKKVVLK